MPPSNFPPERNILDLSHPLISGAVPACVGHPCYTAQLTFSLANGDFANVHTLTLGTHTGTHLDAPYHFFVDGCTVDQLDLSLLAAAPAVAVDLRTKGAHARIMWEDLAEYEEEMRKKKVLLLCTGWSRHWGEPHYTDHPFLDTEAAHRIMETGIRVIAVDTLSPDEVTPEAECGDVHRAILGSGGVIVENLKGLEKIVERGWRNPVVSVLPLNLADCDGSPVRAVAWEGSNE